MRRFIVSDKTELEILNLRVEGFEIWLAKMAEQLKNESTPYSVNYVLDCYQIMVMNKGK